MGDDEMIVEEEEEEEERGGRGGASTYPMISLQHDQGNSRALHSDSRPSEAAAHPRWQ